jgi:hypothetical protein
MNINLTIYLVAKSKVVKGVLLNPRTYAFDTYDKAIKFLEDDFNSEKEELKSNHSEIKFGGINRSNGTAFINEDVCWTIKETTI